MKPHSLSCDLRRSIFGATLLVAQIAGVTALAVAAGAALVGTAVAGSSLYPSSKRETDARKLAQVVGLATRAEIQGLKDRRLLLEAGIPDSALRDGSLGMGRVYCCGGLPEATRLDVLWFYIPPDVPVRLGDVVEIQLGHEGKGRTPGMVNVVARVRESHDATERHCRWDPDQPGKWMRVIYCDWMEAEGWVHKKGIGSPWIKPPTGDSAQ